MNDAHFHLVVNHLPIIIPIVSLIVLVIGLLIKSEAVQRTSYLLFMITGITTVLAFSSGEGAEEMAENLPGVTEYLMHEHEEKAELFSLMSYVLSFVSLLALLANWKQNKFSKWLLIIVSTLAILVIIVGREVGTTGGEIRHTEIRKNTKNPPIRSEERDE